MGADTYFEEHKWQETLGEIARLRAEVARLRKLCASRPSLIWDNHSPAFLKWVDRIDAAGRGEG